MPWDKRPPHFIGSLAQSSFVHGKAVKLFREMNIDAQIGIALNYLTIIPHPKKLRILKQRNCHFSGGKVVSGSCAKRPVS